MVMPLMPANMPVEAHCQEDRGINAEIWYILHFSMSNKPNYSHIAFFISYLTLPLDFWAKKKALSFSVPTSYKIE